MELEISVWVFAPPFLWPSAERILMPLSLTTHYRFSHSLTLTIFYYMLNCAREIIFSTCISKNIRHLKTH